MTTPTHLFGGYLTLSLFRKWWSADRLSTQTQKFLLAYGLFLSLAIDLDVAVTRGITDHHKLITHFPLFWLAVSGLIFFLGKVCRHQAVQSLAIVTLIASWTHMLLDLVGVTMGIHLLAPFSMTEFSLTPLKTDFPSEQERLAYIFGSPVVWIGDSIVIFCGGLKIFFDFRTHLLK